MASIRSSIELQDNFTSILMNVINAVNISVSTMEQMQSVMNEPIDTAAIQGMRDQLNQATIAARELDAAMQGMETSTPAVPESPALVNIPIHPIAPEPLPVPVQWQSYEGVEVFTNTGAERFEQEIARVDSMMGRLSETQAQITQQANESEILSPQASYEIQNVENRVHELVSMINQAESSSLNIGTEETNTQLERLRMQLNQTLQLQNNLDAAMQGMDISEINAAYLRLSQNVTDTERHVRDSFSHIPPVEVPVVWDSPTMEVFTNSGIDRFQAEVQSTNNMLDVLNQAQAEIAARTAQANIFPPNMAADMNGMQNRLQAIQTRIQAIESNPLNMGTDVANAELEQLRTQLNQAVQEQESMNRAVENMDIQAANEAYLRLSQIISGTERHIRDNVDEQGRFNQAIEQGTGSAAELKNMIASAVGAYVTMQTVGNTLNLSDQIVSIMARLDLMNDQLQTTKELNDMVYLSAQRSRGSYLATADAVSKMGLMAGDAFNNSAEVIAFTEQLNKHFRIAGTEAAGIDAAMLQITQAMSSGVLRGEEYNSVLEQAPTIIQAIADYLGVSTGQLRDMASEGQLTAVVVKNALFAMAEETNEKFDGLPKTFSEIWGDFRDDAIMAFQPVLEEMNQIANSEMFQGFVDTATQGMIILAAAAQSTIDLLVSGASWIADNWSWLSPVILGVAGALAVYYGWQMAANAIAAIGYGIHVAMAAAQMIHAAITGALTATTAADIAAQNGLNAAMYACPITWIIILIIALVAALYAGVAAMNKFAGTSISATGITMGAFFIMGAFIYNSVLVPMQQAFARHANFIGNVFNNPIAAVKVAFYDMCLTVIGYIQSLASGIETLLNAIPGVTVDITSGLDRFYSGLEAAQQSVKDESGWIEYVEEWEYMDYTDAANAGYRFGQGIESSIAGFDPASLFENNIPNPEGYMDLSNYAGSGIGDLGGIGSGVDDIAGNTAAMADAMEITGEELKYLRDIAEQEAVNRFTTAEIKIEQTNYNTIRGEMDLDGIVTGLDEAMGEAIEISMEGVHA